MKNEFIDEDLKQEQLKNSSAPAKISTTVNKQNDSLQNQEGLLGSKRSESVKKTSKVTESPNQSLVLNISSKSPLESSMTLPQNNNNNSISIEELADEKLKYAEQIESLRNQLK